jgi:polyphosphate kinase
MSSHSENQTQQLNDPKLFLDRELSLLSFNQRVLALAQDEKIPLLERLKFLCICSSNLDEFFEVRVAAIKQQVDSGISGTDAFAIPSNIALEKIHQQAHQLVTQQYQCLNDELLPQLSKEGINFISNAQIDNFDDEKKESTTKWLEHYFDSQVLPILSPIKLHSASPFPLTINKGLCVILHLQDDKRDKKVPNIAITPIPRALPRILKLPEFDNQSGEET